MWMIVAAVLVSLVGLAAGGIGLSLLVRHRATRQPLLRSRQGLGTVCLIVAGAIPAAVGPYTVLHTLRHSAKRAKTVAVQRPQSLDVLYVQLHGAKLRTLMLPAIVLLVLGLVLLRRSANRAAARPWIIWSAAETDDARVPAELRRGDRRACCVALAVSIVAFQAMTCGLIAWYYRTHLPHYDSVGSYTAMARLAQIARAGEVSTALREAATYHLAWLQSMFAVLAAPILAPTPAGFQLLNTLAVGAFLCAVYRAARDLGASRIKAYLSSLVVLLPDALTFWDGGYQDMRRDGSSFALLGASFFLTFAYLWNPSRSLGMILGVVAGFSVWSRGNALPYMVGIIGPVLGVWFILTVRQHGLGRALRILGWPALLFMLVAGPNVYASFAASIARYLDPVNCWGGNISPWSSLHYYAWMPLTLWATNDGTAGSNNRLLAVALTQTGAVVVLAAVLLGLRVNGRTWLARRQLTLAAGSMWAVAATLFMICALYKWDPAFRWSGRHPLYPTLLGPLGLLVVTISGLHVSAPITHRALILRWCGAVALGLGCVGVTGVRMVLHAGTPEPVGSAQALTELLSREKPDAVVAFLSHDRINFDTLAFLEAQANRSPSRRLQKFFWNLPTGGGVDFASFLPPNTDVPAHLQSLLHQIRERADFVVLSSDPSAYEQPPAPWHYFVFRHGRPVAEALLEDKQFEHIYHYQLDASNAQRHFVVLRNRDRLVPLAARSPNAD